MAEGNIKILNSISINIAQILGTPYPGWGVLASWVCSEREGSVKTAESTLQKPARWLKKVRQEKRCMSQGCGSRKSPAEVRLAQKKSVSDGVMQEVGVY